jgi:hypothetical protein
MALLGLPGRRTVGGWNRQLLNGLSAFREKIVQQGELALKASGVAAAKTSELVNQLADLIMKTVVLTLQQVGDLTKVIYVANVFDLNHERT